jgi:general stress protein 26
MAKIKDLNRKEAIDKMKEMVREINVSMFCTSGSFPLKVRPMATQKVDDDGNFWFLSLSGSDKNLEINDKDIVQLIYGNNSLFMTITGSANITRDKQKINELWDDFAEVWFKGKKNDPQMTAIRITPQTAYYWDTLQSKMVTLLKIAFSNTKPKKLDNGFEGKLSL